MIHESPDGGKTIKSREAYLPEDKSKNLTAVQWLSVQLGIKGGSLLDRALEIERKQIEEAVNSENRKCVNLANSSIKLLGFMESNLFRYDEDSGSHYYETKFTTN